MTSWKTMNTAPKDGTRILILAGDFGIVECYWDNQVENFYKSNPNCAVYDPNDMQGDWVTTYWVLTGSTDDDRRLICGVLPQYCRPVPKLPKVKRFSEEHRQSVTP